MVFLHNTERVAQAPGDPYRNGPRKSSAVPDLGAPVEAVHAMQVTGLEGIHGEAHWKRVAVAGAEGGEDT